MKTEVYSWRLSAARKVALESAARREGISVAELLEQITTGWLAQRRNGDSEDAEQFAIRRRAATAIGSLHGGDLTRSTRASELVREIIARKHAKESRGSLRTARRAN
jgi:hypothetical protein